MSICFFEGKEPKNLNSLFELTFVSFSNKAILSVSYRFPMKGSFYSPGI